MLEVRYNKSTKFVTGWWGSRLGNHTKKLKSRPDEELVVIDVGIPGNVLDNWFYDKANKQIVLKSVSGVDRRKNE